MEIEKLKKRLIDQGLDEEQQAKWLRTKLPALNYVTPQQLIDAGKINVLFSLLDEIEKSYVF